MFFGIYNCCETWCKVEKSFKNSTDNTLSAKKGEQKQTKHDKSANKCITKHAKLFPFMTFCLAEFFLWYSFSLYNFVHLYS